MSWSSSSPVLLGVSAVTLMVGIAAAWYALAVFALTTAMVRSAFHRIRRWIDRIAGIAIMGFGAKLALDREVDAASETACLFTAEARVDRRPAV